MARTEHLECGLIQNTHGVKGVLRVQSWCDSPRVLLSLPMVYVKAGQNMKPWRVVGGSLAGGDLVLLKLEGVEDMDAAEALKGLTLYAARADLPLKEGAYFLADLPSLPVIDAESGDVLGEVIEVRELSGRRLLNVKTPYGERLYPMVSPLLDHVDVDRGVYVRPIPGLLDE
jgi:16S rRNA processing protein RimM